MKTLPLLNFHPHLSLRRCAVALSVMIIVSPSAQAGSIAQQAFLKASNADYFDQFGMSAAVSGDTLVVGAPYESSSATGVNGNQLDNSSNAAGAAYVFVRNGTNWIQQAYLKASNTDANDSFGLSVAISGNTIVIGADESSSATGVNGNQSDNSAFNAGAAYVFVRNGTNWTQQAYLKASNAQAYDSFGLHHLSYSRTCVAVSGDTIVVGAPFEDSNAIGVNGDQSDNSASSSGAAYVFVRSGTNWTQQAYLKASNTGANDYFGWSVAISGDTVVVGAAFEDSNAIGVNGDQNDNSGTNSGAAYVFVRDGTNWSQQAYLKASNRGGWFGSAVAVSGDTVVSGAPFEGSNAMGVNGQQTDYSATNSGAAYIFVRSGTNWSQQAYLKASNREAQDQFGYSVSVSGDAAIIGANLEASNATGVNGNQNNNSAGGSGAAYVFVRSGTNWSQQAYLKASNTHSGDYFSDSVSVSGNTAVVGANYQGTLFPQISSGAAYVFTGLGLGTRLEIVPDGSGGYFVRFNGAPEITYRLQRAPSVSGPWTTIYTQTAPASGLVEYHETTPPPAAAFYRAVTP